MRAIFLISQIAISIVVTMVMAVMLVRSMIVRADACVTLLLAAMVAVAWRMMVKPSIAEYKAEINGEND